MELTKEEIKRIIDYEVIVDCYTDDEANMGWAIFMEENLHFPFEAEYMVKQSGEFQWRKVTVVNNETDETNFGLNQYYVEVELDEMIVPVSLDELRNIEADSETKRTLQVWKNRNLY